MQENKNRITWVKICIIFIFLIFVTRLFFIQILDVYGFYNSYHRYKNKKNNIPAERGIIYDRNGVALAGNKKFYKLEFCPKLIRWDKKDSLSAVDKQIVYDEIINSITKNTDLTYHELKERIETYETDYPYGFELVTNITTIQRDTILKELSKQSIHGIIDYKQKSKRVYPKGALASALIGYYDSDKDQALCGIELVSNNELTGQDGWVEVIHYGTGDEYYFDDMPIQKPIPGKSVYLTIDAHLQVILEKNLVQGIEKYNARGAIGVIISPRTGEVYALKGINKENIESSNRVTHTLPIYPISWQYEPGSTIKPLTALIAIEDNIFHANDIIDCRTRTLGTRIISDVKPYKYLSFKEVLIKSSNCGITRIADNIEPFELYTIFTKFGFGHKTGIMLPGERSGLLRHPSDWSKYSLHSLSFGQEMSVTTLQLAYAYAAIANGGKILQPKIIYRIVDENNKTLIEPKTTIIRHVSNPWALDTLKNYLQAVVDDGQAKATKLGYISIGGKTGTAEKLDPNGGYLENANITSFVGFFPVENPQIVMVIVFDEPDHDHRYGSISAVPTFRNIVEEMIVLPSNDIVYVANETNRQFVLVPDCIGKSVQEATHLLVENNIDFTHFGEGDYIIDQFPKPGIIMLEGSSVILQTGFQIIDPEYKNANLTQK